ncbi:MAG: phage Gp37/Gp68 family protein, partial [Lachnospiraceae bacterium]|nr:phage Gp37/Gp68 family protein [Lachnospiraceae bacterium]
MNRSKIEWCDHTWNPITGCRHECPYCYARTMTARFAGDVRLNKMAKKDYLMMSDADGGEDLYVLD